jgi:hypothetical protein
MNRSSKQIAVAAAVAAALFAVPAVWLARAEQAPTRPARGTHSQANDRADSRPVRRAPAGPRGQRPFDQPVTPEEWAEVNEFMAQYMPWRIATVRQMPEGPAKERVKRLLAVRYHGLRLVQNRDVDSYEARLGQLKIEDQIYKLVSELPGADEQRKEQIHDQLRPEVSSLVDVDLNERQRRVDRLEQELRRQKKLLDQDTRDRENIIERRLARFLDWGSHWPGHRNTASPAGPAAAPGVNAKTDPLPGNQAQPRQRGATPGDASPSPATDK